MQARLVAAIAALAAQSRPAGVKALAGHPGLLQICVGTYRIAYTVRDQELILLVVCLGHRSDVYDTL
ncbi:type II toxin-antitoxin system RelE family toxin [Salinispora arenicola]|uniref:type II toxin-antitoxin system RelE family toxin n=1 Tax=Salinispora arenicola TaxID=168697 RepID=UPI0003760B9B|nr:type II toxin-antitoxin system RelE/ParE family toxin [Salinispora arenicola]